MADPRFPNVPNTIGVPPVLRDGFPLGSEPGLTSDGFSVQSANKSKEQWGIFDTNGGLVLVPDNIVGLEYRAEHRVADYPIEQGGFVSYDKVAMPFDIRIAVSKGGSLEERTAFLNRVEQIRGDLNLYNVATPERTYLNVNIVMAAMTRNSSNGAGLITIELGLREIRTTATIQFSQSQTASGATAINGGSVQPVAVPDPAPITPVAP